VGGEGRGREREMKKNYGYHIIDNSPWVIFTTISIFSLLLSNILYINKYIYSEIIIIISFLSIIINLWNWWGEVIVEGSIKGEHTGVVQAGIIKGFILFVISEICIFITLFYTFFYSSIIPDIHLGSIWPPIGIDSINYKSIPLLNTMLLFFSGISLTVAQYKIKLGNYNLSKLYIIYTIILALLFVYMQYIEYKYSTFNIMDSIYGSIFYTLTGFHGLHVILGLLFILVALLRLNQYSISHHMNFILSSIYFHFVDIVWLILYGLLYIWSSGIL
jgi:cytochrome c oxidase subunit 3